MGQILNALEYVVPSTAYTFKVTVPDSHVTVADVVPAGTVATSVHVRLSPSYISCGKAPPVLSVNPISGSPQV